MEEDRKKQLLAALAGLVDPWLRQKAQEVAGTVSENSVLRNKSVEAVLGSLKGFIETWAEKLPPAAATAIEKATDFSDFFAGALGTTKVPVSGPVVDDWMKKFFAESGQRLREAQDVQVEYEKIKLEFELRKQLLELIKQSQPAPEVKPKPEPVSWREELEKLKQSAIAQKGAKAIGDVTDHVNRLNTTLESWLGQVTAWSERRQS